MNLNEILNRATDVIEPPDLAGAALKRARERRHRRFLIAGAAAVVVAIIGTATVVTARSGDGQHPEPVGPVGPPSRTTPIEDATITPHRAAPLRGTQPAWDARGLDELPPSPAGTVPGLATSIDPPDSSRPLAGAPMDAAILAVVTDDVAQVLSVSGQWRSVPVGREPRLDLSPSGSRIAISDRADGPGDSIVIGDVVTGVISQVPYPDDLPSWDFATVGWVDEDTLLFGYGGSGRLIDAESGAETPVPYPATSGWSVDSDGVVVESPAVMHQPEFIDWSGGTERRVRWPIRGGLQLVHANGPSVAGTWGAWVAVVDRASLTPRKVLPVIDPDGSYANGLSVLAVQDGGTILFRVTDERAEGAIRIVAWQPTSGDLSLLSSLPIVQVEFAEGLLRHVDP